MANFPIFQKIAPNVPSFWSILHIKCLNCIFFLGKSQYLGSSYQLTAYLAFCLANIPIFSGIFSTKYRYNPKIIRFYRFFGVIDNYPLQK